MGCGKATKGPWRVRKDENGDTVVATMPEPSDIMPGATQSWHLAIVMGTPGGRDKQANADLIAAAPDMLQALEAVEWTYQGHCPLCVNHRDEGHKPDCFIGNALKKARGEI